MLDRIRARAAASSTSARLAGVRLGIGDDCALLGLRSGEEAAVTTDLSLTNRHFRLDWHSPEVVGYRALARGLSDLAAMGARPVAAFLSLGLPPELTRARGGGLSWPGGKSSWRGSKSSWIDRFYEGFLALAGAHGTPLAGGDLAESPVALADVVLVGAVRRGRALLRSGASAGHLLYVTGSLGGAAVGLDRLAALAAANKRPGPPRIPARLKAVLAPHLAPEPRLAQGLFLARRGPDGRGLASAAIDLSDGLSTDLAHLCAESGVAAEIDAAALPLYPGATLAQALHGGEDYELLFTAAATVRLPHAIAGVPVTCIGRVLARRAGRPAITLRTEKGREPLEPQGWQHFG